MFASLTVPALATRTLRSHALAFGYAIGLLGYLIELLLSVVYDLPTGAVIVWTLTGVALVAAPLLARWRVPLARKIGRRPGRRTSAALLSTAAACGGVRISALTRSALRPPWMAEVPQMQGAICGRSTWAC